MLPRLAILALAITLALTALPAGASAPAAVAPNGPGDFQCDQHTDVNDSLVLAEYLANLAPDQNDCPALGAVTRATNGKIAWEGDGEIYTMDADGSNKQNITNDSAFDWYPSWSRDGRHIAFSSDRGGGKDHIWIMDPDGGNLTQLTFGDTYDDDQSTWSPDGMRLAFDRYDNHNHIAVINIDGGDNHNITPNSDNSYSPSWSPTADLIAFVRSGSGTANLYTMQSDGTHVKPLFVGSDYSTYPSFSPDGTKIAFSKFTSPAPSDIFVIPAGGGTAKNLTPSQPQRDLEPAWSADGQYITFESNRDEPNPDNCQDCNYEVYRIDSSNGANSTRLTNSGGNDETPVWQAIPTSRIGDLNCDGAVDTKDLIVSLAHDAHVDVHLPDGCPSLNS